MMVHTPNPALYLSPEMVAELALGVDPPLDVAQKYGLSAAEFYQLQQQEWFGAAIYRKREELHANGVTFSIKAQMMAEEMWSDIYLQSKQAEMKMEHRIEAAKQLTDIAGLKPKAAAAGVAGGPQFQIVINLPDNAQGPSLRPVDPGKADKTPAMVIDMTPTPVIPPPPAGLKVPDFKLKDDLVGVSTTGQAPHDPHPAPTTGMGLSR